LEVEQQLRREAVHTQNRLANGVQDIVNRAAKLAEENEKLQQNCQRYYQQVHIDH